MERPNRLPWHASFYDIAYFDDGLLFITPKLMSYMLSILKKSWMAVIDIIVIQVYRKNAIHVPDIVHS